MPACTAASPGPCCSYRKGPDNVRGNTMDKRIKFMHYRNIDDAGEVVPSGGTTVAYVEEENGTRLAFARCSPYDNYNKSYGRAKASGRLKATNTEETRYQVSTRLKGNEFVNFCDTLFLDNSWDFHPDDIPY